MPTDNDYDLKRLGPLLQERRARMNPRFSRREVFARERDISARAVSDIELGRPRVYSFKASTWHGLETAYALEYDSLQETARRGPLRPLPIGDVTTPAPRVTGDTAAADVIHIPSDPRTRAVIVATVDGSPLERAVRQRIARFPRRSRGEDVFINQADIAIWNDRGLGEDVRVEMIAALWALRNDVADVPEHAEVSLPGNFE